MGYAFHNRAMDIVQDIPMDVLPCSFSWGSINEYAEYSLHSRNLCISLCIGVFIMINLLAKPTRGAKAYVDLVNRQF